MRFRPSPTPHPTRPIQPPWCWTTHITSNRTKPTTAATAATTIRRRYLTALAFARAGRGLTAIEGDLCANMVVIALVLGLNAGAYLGFLWLLAAPAAA